MKDFWKEKEREREREKGRKKYIFGILYMGYLLSIVKINWEIEKEREKKRDRESKK